MNTQNFLQSQNENSEQITQKELLQSQKQAEVFQADALLADIDSLLEANAHSFVQGFVQKGGQ